MQICKYVCLSREARMLMRNFQSILGREFGYYDAHRRPLPLLVRPVRRYVSEFLHLMLLGAGPRHTAGAIVEFARVSGEQPVNRFFESGQGRDKLELDDLVQAVYYDKVASGALNQARIAKSSVLAKNLGNMVSR